MTTQAAPLSPAKAPSPNDLIEFDVIAREAGVDVRTVRGWAAAGMFPVVRITSRCVRVRRSAWDRFIASRTT